MAGGCPISDEDEENVAEFANSSVGVKVEDDEETITEAGRALRSRVPLIKWGVCLELLAS